MLTITIGINDRTIAEITASLRVEDSLLPEQGSYNVVVREFKFNAGDAKPFITDTFVVSKHQRSDGAIRLAQEIMKTLGETRLLPAPSIPCDTVSIKRRRYAKAQREGYVIRTDGRIERMCEHGVGHPVGNVDPAQESGLSMWVHGCCCNANGDPCCGTYERFAIDDE